jgi:hypothetical protein
VRRIAVNIFALLLQAIGMGAQRDIVLRLL